MKLFLVVIVFIFSHLISSAQVDSLGIFTCAYLDECSLTTSNDAKIWCTELSLKRIILENYSYPTLSDTSTFVNRENYQLNIFINPSGKIDSLSINGCSNPDVKQAIFKAIKQANVLFNPAKNKDGLAVSYTYQIKLRAFAFSNAARIAPSGNPQKPVELTEDEQEKYQGKVLQGYHMN